MSKNYITSLGDKWVVDQNYVRSENTKNHYFLSEPLLKILNAADADPSKISDENFNNLRARMSSNLREIEKSPMSPDGNSFLIADRSLGGIWSHPVRFDHPKFDWKDRAQKEGTLYVLSENPEIGIESRVGNAEMNKEAPGSGDDVFNVMVFDKDSKKYCIAHQTYTFSDAERYVLENGNIAKPLPPLSYEENTFMDIPSCNSIGLKGVYAEMQLRTVITDGVKGQYCDLHLMDQYGQCLASSIKSIENVFLIRDNPDCLNEFIKESKHNDEHGLLHMFKNSESLDPKTIDDFLVSFHGLGHNKFLKLETANKEYQMLLSYELVDTYRDFNGKCLHRGSGVPTESALEGCKDKYLTRGTEKAYKIIVKHTDGSMTRSISNVLVDTKALFRLLNEPEAMEELVSNSRLKAPRFSENMKTGDAPCIHQLIGSSVQGKVFDRNYTGSERVLVSSLRTKPKEKPEIYESLSM